MNCADSTISRLANHAQSASVRSKGCGSNRRRTGSGQRRKEGVGTENCGF
jgi:hypothetical protein